MNQIPGKRINKHFQNKKITGGKQFPMLKKRDNSQKLLRTQIMQVYYRE